MPILHRLHQWDKFFYSCLQLNQKCITPSSYKPARSILRSLPVMDSLIATRREAEVLFWVMQGKDNKSIAAQLDVHKSTVRKHLENIYCKLGVQSRTEVISQALENLGFLYSLPLS